MGEGVSLLGEPDAGDPPVRFDEREVETGHGQARRAPADERAGNSYASPNLPRHLSTLLLEFNKAEQVVFDFFENSPKRWNDLTHEEQQHMIEYIERIGGFRGTKKKRNSLR